jgi:hypothetical protein
VEGYLAHGFWSSYEYILIHVEVKILVLIK